MLVRWLFAGVAVAAIVGCAKPEAASVDSTQAMRDSAKSPAATASKIGETGDMKTPESVRYDPDLDAYFVANINGNASQHDGNGFIAMVRADSTGVVKHLVEGGKNGAVLDAPKGMAISGDTLWVADIDAVRAFNKRTGAPITSVSLKSQKATFLNDVAIGPDGVYITDTGIVFDAKGGMTHPGVNWIFKLTGGKVSEVASGDSLSNPNGMTWDRLRTRWLLAPFGGNDVQVLNPGDKAPKKLASGPGQYDGIEVLADGRILVSSWADSAVHIIVNDSNMSVLVPNVAAPADIGVDTKRNVVAVPRFNDNKVEYYKIP